MTLVPVFFLVLNSSSDVEVLTQFLSGVNDALSEVDQSNVQVMAYDKVVRSVHVVRMNNVALVEKAQGVHHLRCPKHNKFLESFFDLFAPFKFLRDREFDQVSARWVPKIQCRYLSGIQALTLVIKIQETLGCRFPDILIFIRSWDDHLKHLAEVLQALRKYQLYCKPSKCVLGVAYFCWMGHIHQRGKWRPRTPGGIMPR